MSADGSSRCWGEHCEGGECVHPCAHEQAIARDNHPSNRRAPFRFGSVVPESLRQAEAKIAAAWRRLPAGAKPAEADELVMAVDHETGWIMLSYARMFGGR